MDEQRPPWREPMMWLVVGLPLASVVAGIALVVTASRSGSNDAVADPVQRTAQIQVADLGPDARAQQLRLSAIVRFDRRLIEVLPVTGQFSREQPLRLALRHPARASADVELLLRPTKTGWRAPAVIDDSHDWNVQLLSEDGRWRLRGRLPKQQRAAHLKPALQGP
jgi:hypothetical protein